MAKVFEFVTELIGWVSIVISPFLAGLAIGTIIYFNSQDNIGLFSGIIVSILGLVIGIIIATRAWKKKGTIYFLSRISATPELDNLEDKEPRNSINK